MTSDHVPEQDFYQAKFDSLSAYLTT